MKIKKPKRISDSDIEINPIRIPRSFRFNFDVFEGEKPKKRKR